FNQRCADEQPLFVPSAFSPNDDGINDVLQIYKSADIWAQVLSCRIYDRWGGLIFASGRQSPFPDRADLWEGDRASAGVYVYVVEVQYQQGQVRQVQGVVTLLR
ncbi:MAG: gliding motility-associated C-terminal domain-containing protein, partial [Bacteroidota bacterium]